jgi:hypothetical protein
LNKCAEPRQSTLKTQPKEPVEAANPRDPHLGTSLKGASSAEILVLTYDCEMSRVAKVKNGFAPKTCERCGLEFEWRKKWAKNWMSVKYCSERCRENIREKT